MKGENGFGKKGPEKLLEAIGELPEEMIAEAADTEKIHRLYQRNRRRPLISVGKGLAAAAIIAVVVWGVYRPSDHIAMEKGAELDFFCGEQTENDSEESSMEKWNSNDLGREGAARELGIYFPSDEAEVESAAGEAVNDGQHALYTFVSGKGKTRMAQSALVLGETGENREYSLTASEGISFLTAVDLGKTGEERKKTKGLGETGQYQCSSGTQITFSLPKKKRQDEDITEDIPARIRASWAELEIEQVGYIKVCVEEETKEQSDVIILVGKREGVYYAEIFQ